MQSQKWYCLKCRTFTPTQSIQQTITKNNRPILKGKCEKCGSRKSMFLTIGKGIVNDILNSGKLPELHLPGHSYTGPGTKLKERLLRGDKPINKLDQAAQFHDMAYSMFKDTKDRHVFDKKLQDEAWSIAKDPNSSVKEKIEAGLVSGIMAGKRKLGLGNSNK